MHDISAAFLYKEYRMETIRLILPSMEYDEEIMSLRAELLAAQDKDDFASCSGLDDFDSTEGWLNHLEAMRRGMTPSVPSDCYLAVREKDHRVVGVIDLRHHIDHPILGSWGGHMGYTVRPSERGRGYAKQMLHLNLENCRALGLERVLITCSRDNPASEHTIVANGGVFEKEISVGSGFVRRYWIKL